MNNTPGYYQGRHYSDYDKELKTLAKAKQTTELETLLLHLLDAIEAESQAEQLGIPPGYYDELAEIYHQQHNYTAEVALYQRFFKQIQLPNVSREGLQKRLQHMNEAKKK
jgi:hypothetical protein